MGTSENSREKSRAREAELCPAQTWLFDNLDRKRRAKLAQKFPSSLPGLTRQSIPYAKKMDPRVKPAGDEWCVSQEPGQARE